jgi:dTDP-4-dehydrorhamnose 3,5-epimerase
MEQPIIKKFSIDGLLQINRPVFPDDRGFFKEIIRIGEIEKILGKEFIIRQANHSRSTKNTLRGIHVAPWNKLVYVVKGKVQAVVADCRRDSATFGKHESIIIGEENKSSIFIPAGCGNSYLVLSEDADYIYLTDQEYAPNLEKSIAWNDSTLAIKWQLEGEPLLSEKDKMNPPFLSI